MSLRPLVEIAAENERLHALAGRACEAAAGGRRSRSALPRCCDRCCWRRCSRTTAASPGVPPSWSAPMTAPPATSPPICAPIWRRAGSAFTPREGPATPLTSPRRHTWSGCESMLSTRCARKRTRWSSPALRRSPRRCPTPPCAPPASRSPRVRRSTSPRSPRTWSRPVTSGSIRSRSAGGSPSAAASSMSSRRLRSAPCGSSCSAMRSSRCAGSRPSPSARWATATGSSWPRQPSSTQSTASWPSWRRWRPPRRGRSRRASATCCRWRTLAPRSTSFPTPPR